PLFLEINSRKGTSKLHFIKLLFFKLKQIVRNPGKGNPIIRNTPTKVIINNIDRQTLHSLFKLPIIFKNINPNNPEIANIILEGINLIQFQTKLRLYRYFIIDEKSILGLRTLDFIN
ncbi:hypothetical protein NEUTE2DRAFT_52682, partial [Neurospora tetrasperma FGSC 2509]